MSFFNSTVFQGTRHDRALKLPQCGKCGLARGCKSPKLPPMSKGRRRILFVGESPGAAEDARGKHFAGKDGVYLRKVLKRLKVKLEDCQQTYSIICAPDEEVTDKFFECCRPNLLKTIRDLKPKVIILLGSAAVRSLMPTEREGSTGGIERWVGWTVPSHEHQAWICPLNSPTYLRRKDDKVLDMLFRRRLKKALSLEKKKVPGADLEKLKGEIEVITNVREGRNRLRELAKKKGILSFDYEGTGLKPEHPAHRIVSCSFCLDGKDTFALLINHDNEKLLSKVLQSEKLLKVAANLKHEERWTFNKLGHTVASWHWDTMLNAHLIDNRKGITSLKFQAFIHLGIADYQAKVAPFFQSDEEGFNRIDEVPIEELLLYNGLDSLLTYMIMERQKKVMRLA